ncbi:cytosolic carboxypeptidase 4 isoform X2 [Conger conger]|uniref:cytosolic carboxypeptidase 4 isoform X2 n=2 Tax=Conger conger TaxID=82655 RepID=UPI002A5A81C7|nr:cytosolic carboxypeptidase 4 isoform X2 [Conger conger]
MFGYRQCSRFTWTGTLETYGQRPDSERGRPTMATTGGSGLEVLLATLQGAGDTESTLNILNVLDELLSAGTDRRIHYMISKGGSEALLSALVKTARSHPPNYTLLLPLLHLLAKVGHRDKRIGVKAEKVEAVLLTLGLLRQNWEHPRRAAACLWVLRVFCSSVSTATLLGENRGLDVVFKLVSVHTTKHTRTVKAAVDAFAALLRSKANSRCAVAKGYVSSLLKLYEDWHGKDATNAQVPIRRALLRCLHHASSIREGRDALLAEGGMTLLFQSTQTCLASQATESLAELSVQLMRKCSPKCPLQLTSDWSVYCFPLPGRPTAGQDTDPGAQDDSLDEDSDDDSQNGQSDSLEYDDDLETDPDKLRERPKPERSPEELSQYMPLCSELYTDFQEFDVDTEAEDSSETEVLLNGESSPGRGGHATPEGTRPPSLSARDFHSWALGSGAGRDGATALDLLLECRQPCVPHHDPRAYAANAARTASVPGFSALAFPDLWGHLPPQGPEPMATRKPNVQRKKVFEDIQRQLNPEDMIGRVVFDLEEASPQCQSEQPDSLRFYSKFESGNLRKAIQVRRYEYDLVLNADVNCSQHLQWFYFEVSGMQSGVPYRFNVVCCEKANSQFNYGMQPVLYSVREALEGRPQWVRTGTEICYYRNHFCPSRGPKGPAFYTLTFTVTFPHSEDVCYLAYHYPYTYSALQTHLQMLEQKVDRRKVFFRKQTLCHTLAGNPCPLLTITALPESRSWGHLQELRQRPYVVLTGRVHPGESNASWVMKGSLEFLCSSDPVAESLREAYIFKVIPMLNPDGVINGTLRCSLNGEDLNRQWIRPDPALSPTIFHSKGLLYRLQSVGRTPLVFCDYHGHSRKKNVFLYGCSVKETLWQAGATVNNATLKEDPGHRTIPKTLDRIAPAFSFNSCNYLVEKSRASTARVVVWREMGVVRSYTMESTYNGCDQGIYKGLQVGSRELEEMGLKFCQSLLPLRMSTLLSSPKLFSQASALLDLNDSPLDHKSHNCFEDDEPACAEEIEYLNADFPEDGGEELDADVNGNTSSSEEEEEEEEGEEGREEEREERWLNGHTDRNSRLFPRQAREGPLKTLNGRRTRAVDIGNGQYLS